MLEYHTHTAADLIDIHARGCDLLPVEGNAAAGGLLQKVQAAQECGFTGSGGAYDNHLLARCNMHIDIFDNMIVAK